MIPQSRYVTIEGYEIHYMEWGSPERPPLILWHALSRTGRDFDDLAEALADNWHIIAPDTLGRGLSAWSTAPERDYCHDFYARLAQGLVDSLALPIVDWVGTSMGGAIGIRAAATTLRGRVRRMVLNDMGPKIADAAVARVRSYAGSVPVFDTVTGLEAWLREVYVPFGLLTDAQWRRMAETSARRLSDGRITLHYDPKITMQFTARDADYAQWPQWDALTCKILCLRGETSDLLLPEDAEEMTRRGPPCELVTIPGCGHAPALNVLDQIDLVAKFLRRDQ